MNDIEQEVYNDLEESETVNDIFTAIEKLEGEQETVVGHTLTSTAGALIAQGISNKKRDEKLKEELQKVNRRGDRGV